MLWKKTGLEYSCSTLVFSILQRYLMQSLFSVNLQACNNYSQCDGCNIYKKLDTLNCNNGHAALTNYLTLSREGEVWQICLSITSADLVFRIKKKSYHRFWYFLVMRLLWKNGWNGWKLQSGWNFCKRRLEIFKHACWMTGIYYQALHDTLFLLANMEKVKGQNCI